MPVHAVGLYLLKDNEMTDPDPAELWSPVDIM